MDVSPSAMSESTAVRTVLVTGSARRIGAAIVRRLHASGWNTAIHYGSSAEEARALVAELDHQRPGRAAAFPADLRDEHAGPNLVQAVRAKFGGLHALVNNASSYFPGPLGSITAAAVDELVATNLKAPLLLTQAAWQAGGLQGVVNLLDAHSRSQPRVGFAAYTAAKDGLWSLTESLAVELAPVVRVNGVALGHIAATVRTLPSAAERIDLIDKATQLPRVPMGRFGDETDVAEAVDWLLSDAARYITGTVITIDGGRRLA